ncbi:MAG: hypothetical protein QOF48_3056 [Verrucomicrobiota bacterium]
MKKILRAGAALVSLLAAAHAADPVTLLPDSAAGRFFVPTNGGLGSTWIAPVFNDSAWTNVTAGIGFDSPKAPILPGGVVADSVAEFSGTQGASNWYYGYWTKGGDPDATYQSWDFAAFPRQPGNNIPGANNFWDGTQWHWFNGNPPWDELTATGGRPSGPNGTPVHYVIRRWISELNGPVHLVGAISHNGACGDGVDLRIWVDGVELLGIANVLATNIPFAINAEVQIGSTVDFAVGPNVANDSCDTYNFNVKVLQNTLADSLEDFCGIQGARGWSYGYYNKSGDGDAVYNPITDFINTPASVTFNGAWNVGPGDPPWTMIEQTNMRPNSSPEHWPIRRYTSSYAGPIRIAGTLSLFQACGGGTRARILVDGTQIFSRDVSLNSIGYSVLTTVAAGSKIDFSLDPNGDDGCDVTAWTATIQPAASSSTLIADSELEFSGIQGQDNWYYGFYDRSADADAVYNPVTDFNRTDPNWTFGGGWALGPGDPPWDALGRLETRPNGVNSGMEHWTVRRWVSKAAGALTIDWHFSKSNVGGDGTTLLVLQNGVQVDAGSVRADDLVGVRRTLSVNARRGDLIEFVQTPVGPGGDRGDVGDGALFNARIYAHAYNPGAICVPMADSQTDWDTAGRQGYRGWNYGYYNKTADVTPGYQATDFTPFPRDGAGWGATDFWDGGAWNWNPDPAPWDTIGMTFVMPNGTNTFVSEEHWMIRRWLSAVTGTLRIDWFTRKVNPFGNGVTGKILHSGTEVDWAATADQNGFRHSFSVSGVTAGDPVDLALTPVGPGNEGDDGADGSDNGMTIYSCTNVIDFVRTDVSGLMQNVNSSAFLRQRFVVSDVSCLDQLRLRVKYDDGFVAWLNGIEIARRNVPAAPAVPSWNSRALTARTTAAIVAPEIIDITAFKNSLVAGTNVLAMQVLNRFIDDPNFLVAPEITATVLPPMVLSEPQSRTNLLDEIASFHVVVKTCAAAEYQWRGNGLALAGQTNDVLLVPAQLENQTGYDVVISNAGGSITSGVAVLTVNRPPIALDHGVATPLNTSVALPVRKLLNSDSDPDGDPFALVSIASPTAQGGQAILSGGNVLYTPPGGFTGNDTFAYRIADNRGGTATANVQVFVYSGTLPSQNQVLILPVPGGQRVRFAGVPGQSYVVQRTLNLTAPVVWTTLQAVTAPAYGIMEYTDMANLPSAFYRTMPGQ